MNIHATPVLEKEQERAGRGRELRFAADVKGSQM